MYIEICLLHLQKDLLFRGDSVSQSLVGFEIILINGMLEDTLNFIENMHYLRYTCVHSVLEWRLRDFTVPHVQLYQWHVPCLFFVSEPGS